MEWIEDHFDNVAYYFGITTASQRKKLVMKAESERLDRIRLEEAKAIAAERMAREHDAAARRAKEEYRLAKEAAEREMIAKRKQQEEEEQTARAAEMRRPKNSLVYDTSHGCPGNKMFT